VTDEFRYLVNAPHLNIAYLLNAQLRILSIHVIKKWVTLTRKIQVIRNTKPDLQVISLFVQNDLEHPTCPKTFVYLG
jgi:hypothetical protein